MSQRMKGWNLFNVFQYILISRICTEKLRNLKCCIVLLCVSWKSDCADVAQLFWPGQLHHGSPMDVDMSGIMSVKGEIDSNCQTFEEITVKRCEYSGNKEVDSLIMLIPQGTLNPNPHLTWGSRSSAFCWTHARAKHRKASEKKDSHCMSLSKNSRVPEQHPPRANGRK